MTAPVSPAAVAAVEKRGALVLLRTGADQLDEDRRRFAGDGNLPALCYQLAQLGDIFRHLYDVRDSIENAILHQFVEDLDGPRTIPIPELGKVAEVYWESEVYRPRNRWRVRLIEAEPT